MAAVSKLITLEHLDLLLIYELLVDEVRGVPQARFIKIVGKNNEIEEKILPRLPAFSLLPYEEGALRVSFIKSVNSAHATVLKEEKVETIVQEWKD